VAEAATIKYRAFLSYSHRDTAWGKWLHSALEGFRIDRDLVGRTTPAGPVPKTLRPIFRDREDFSAGHSLTAQTLAALEASQFLIVICSPNAAQSPYVNEEIRRFKALGRTERIIPVIVAGEPGDPTRECFPPALRFKLNSDGALTDEREEPIAADARPQGDGKEIAKQKVVAGLLGLGLDEIVRRAERARRRRNRIWGALAGIFLLLAVGATGSAAYAWHQLKTNEAFLNATLRRTAQILDDAVTQAERYNVPRTATLALLARAEGLLDDMAQYGRPTPALRFVRAWMLIQFARNYAILGDSDKQLTRATEAQRLLAALVADDPDEPIFQGQLAVALSDVGDVLQAQGKLDEALASHRAGLAINQRLAAADPGNAGWQRDLAVAYRKVGDVLRPQGKLDQALASYRASLAIQERLAALDRSNAKWQRDLSEAHWRVGDALRAKGDLAAALKEYEAHRAIMKRLASDDRNNAGWQRDLAVAHSNVGDVLRTQGKLDEALASYRAGFAIFERLTVNDPSNASAQRDLSESHWKAGDVLRAKGDLAAALKEYQAHRAIMERLAAAIEAARRR